MEQQILCSCIYCKEVKSVKGIHTHVARAHLGATHYSSGHNGKYNDTVSRAKIKDSRDKFLNLKLGELTKFSVVCEKCNVVLSVTERALQFPTKAKYFCSLTCSNSHVVTEEHRQQTSATLSGRIYKPPEEITKNCINCNTPFTYTKHYTKRDRKTCSRSCSTTHSNISRGIAVRLRRPALTNYRADCNFKFSLNDYPTEFDFTLVEQYGWYKAKNRGDNLTGVSRDHMVSVRYGFDNNIASEIIRHPANCMLMQHNKNSSKHSKCSILLDELLTRIKEWDIKYSGS